MTRRAVRGCLWLALALGACAPASPAVEPAPQASVLPAVQPAEPGEVCSESKGARAPALYRVVVRGGGTCERVESQAGEPLDEERVDRDLRALFAEKAYSDVVVALEEAPGGRVLAFEVKWLPKLRAIQFDGAKAMDRAALLEAAGLAVPWFRPGRAKRGAERLAEAYRTLGYRKAAVDWSAQNVSETEVSLTYRLVEGPRFTLRTVKVVGNKSLPESAVLEALAPHVGQPLDEESEAAAGLRVQALYYDRGMVQASVKTREITEAPDGALELVLEAEEGPVFRVQKVTFEGDACMSAPELRAALKGLKANAVFHRSLIKADVTAIETACRAAGKAGTAEILTELDPKKRTIAVTVRLAPGG